MFGGQKSGKRAWGATVKFLSFLSLPVPKRQCNLISPAIPKPEVFTILMTGLLIHFCLSEETIYYIYSKYKTILMALKHSGRLSSIDCIIIVVSKYTFPSLPERGRIEIQPP